MKSMKSIFTAMMIAVAMLSIAACGGNVHAATSNEFVSGNSIYTIAGFQMVTVGAGKFTVQYNDANQGTNIEFQDPTGAQFTAIRQGAPAFKSAVQVGASGIWINLDETKYINCQVGTALFGVPATYGDHIAIAWKRVGGVALDDAGCATYTSIKAGAN